MKKVNGKRLLNIFTSWEVDNDNILSMECTCVACPLQFEGVLKDGGCFYFRDRHGEARFAIANSVAQAVQVDEEDAFFYWSGKGDYWSEQASKQISKLVDDYFAKKVKK